MSKKEDGTLKLIIGTLMVLTGVFAYLATKIEVVSWWLVAISFLLFGIGLFLIFYRGHQKGIGTVAKESDLDSTLSYRIDQIVRMMDGNTLLFLGGNMDYDTQVVVEPRREGFKKFEVLNDEHHSYLVPKRLKAKIVDGRVWTPVK